MNDMKQKYIFFWDLTTGYIEGSIPPVFDKSKKKPYPACGSSALLPVDGRYSLENIKRIAVSECKKRNYVGYSVGYLNSPDYDNKIRQSILSYTPLI